MNKAVENNFKFVGEDITNKKNKKKKKPKMEEDGIGGEVEIKYGFCKVELFQEYENIFHMSLVDSDHGKINLNIDKQSKEEYLKIENDLINNVFKNVYFVKFKTKEEALEAIKALHLN